MPIINITTWPTPNDIKEKVMIEMTRVIHEITGAPLDKITIFIQEVEKNSWAEGGVLGDDVEFSFKSRRTEY